MKKPKTKTNASSAAAKKPISTTAKLKAKIRLLNLENDRLRAKLGRRSSHTAGKNEEESE